MGAYLVPAASGDEEATWSLSAAHVVAQLCDAKPHVMNITVAGFASGKVCISML